MTDSEKHEFCKKTTGFNAVFLPPALYERAEAEGHDMRYFVPQQQIPVSALAHRLQKLRNFQNGRS